MGNLGRHPGQLQPHSGLLPRLLLVALQVNHRRRAAISDAPSIDPGPDEPHACSFCSGGQWNSGGNCDGETEPITEDKHLAKYLKLTGILESVIGEMTTPVLYLNITRMTDYRKDAHPSVYRVPAGKRKPGEFQDCSHWCLPGVPDAWNELLYAMLLRELS